MHPSLCPAKLDTPYPHFNHCEYDERLWTGADNDCPHIACRIRAEEAARQAHKIAAKFQKLQLKHQARVLPLIHLSCRSKSVRKYVEPVPVSEPKKQPYKGHYDLELNVLYTIPEVEEPKEIVVDIESDEARRSWALYEAKAVKMIKPVVRKMTINKPLPALPNTDALKHRDPKAGLQQYYAAGSATKLAPAPVQAKAKAIPHPISLRAATKVQTDTEKLTHRRTTHDDSIARAQAQELATTKHIPHPISLQAASKAQDTEILTPRRTTHADSTARSQAQELTAIKPVVNRDVSTKSFAVRTAAREAEQPAEQAKAERRYARIFGSGAGMPLAPRAAVRLSAVGLRDVTSLERKEAEAKASTSVIKAFVLEVKNEKPPPKLRRVSRMTHAFDNQACF